MSLSTVDNYLIALFLVRSSLITAATDSGNLHIFITISLSKQVPLDNPRRIIPNPKIYIDKLQNPANRLTKYKQKRVISLFCMLCNNHKTTENDKKYTNASIDKRKRYFLFSLRGLSFVPCDDT